MIPESNFITTILNINDSDVELFTARVKDNVVFYEITLKKRIFPCPSCNGALISYGHKVKTINHPALKDNQSLIIYHANRYICKECKRTCLERNPFAFEGFSNSYMALRKVMDYLGNLNYNLEMISKELNISRTQINKYLDSYVTIPKRKIPECIGIDELHSPALGRNQSTYICVIVDNEHRCLYDVFDSRSKGHLADQFSSIPREERYTVKYVTIDMWEPYKDIANIYFPRAIVAVDPFHVIEHLCRGFSDLRIRLMKSCPYDSNGYYLLKKWHWLLEKDDVLLDNERTFNHRFGTKLNRRDIKELLETAFPDLYEAYGLKEMYRKFNRTASYEEALERYDTIVTKFKNCDIPEYYEFTKILINWKTEILNSFIRPYQTQRLSNALAETMNSKIRAYLVVSRGITNFTRFRKRILYALNPNIQYAITSNLRSDKRHLPKRGSYNKIHE